MNNILVSLKRIDKRIIGAVVVGIALLIALNFLWVGPAQSNLTDQQDKLTVSREELARDQARLADLQSGGTSSIEDLLRKVALMERALPVEVDDLALSKKAAQSAAESGMAMQSFQPVGEFTEIGDEIGIRTYSFSVTGTVSQLATWVDTLERDPTNLMLFTELTAAADSSGSAAEGEVELGLFTTPVTATGQIVVFFSMSKPLLVVPEPEESASPASSTGPSAPAADPSAAPATPADLGPGVSPAPSP